MTEGPTPDFSAWHDANRWLVACSGGVDSTALLLLLQQYRQNHPTAPPLQLWHVNHQLSPAAAGWAAHCQTLCASLNLPFHCFTVQPEANTGQGPEAAARKARYQAFAQALQAGDVLFTAHHSDDQAETLLYRLCRGAGVKGLAAMPRERPLGAGTLARPLLAFSKAQLQHCVKAAGYTTVEDSSNADTRFDRNFLRQQVMPPLQARWPQAVRNINRAVNHLQVADKLLQQLAALDLAAAATRPGELVLDKLAGLSRERLHNALYYWLAAEGITVSSAQLTQLQALLHSADNSRAELRLGAKVLHRYRGLLYAEPWFDVTTLPPQSRWQCETELTPQPGLSIRAEPVRGCGLRADVTADISFAVGGLRFKPAWRQHSTTLKKLWQERHIPPWHRPLLPKLLLDGSLIAVAGIGIKAGFLARANQPGYRVITQIGCYSYLIE